MRPFQWKSYAAAAAVVAAAVSVRLLIGIIDQQALVYAVFYPAVLISALWFGTGPGIFAAVLSLLGGWFVFASSFGLGLDPVNTAVNLSLFTVCSGLIIWVVDTQQRSVKKLADEEEMRQLLVNEMRHRSRNTLTVARALIDRTLRDDPDKARTLYTRMRILLDTEGLFENAQPDGELLDSIFRAELEPHGSNRFAMTGAPLRLGPAQSRSLALVAHELATNAVKYGALATPSGSIDISWSVRSGALELDWRESQCTSGKPARDASSGFGTRLIDIVIGKLDGKVERKFLNSGLNCRLIIPLAIPGTATAEKIARQPAPLEVGARH